MSTPVPPRVLADRLVAALLEQGCTLHAHDDARAILSHGNRTIVILQAATAFDHMPNLGQIGNAEVAVLGGNRDVWARLKKARPWVTQGRVHGAGASAQQEPQPHEPHLVPRPARARLGH